MLLSSFTADQRILQSNWMSDTTGHTGSPSLDDYLRAKKLRSLDSLYRYWWSNDPAIQLTESYNSPTLIQKSSLTCYLWLMIIFMQNQKSKRLIDCFYRYWLSKSSPIWLDERHKWPYPIKTVSLRCCLPLSHNSMQKKNVYIYIYIRYHLIPEILMMIKESYNLIGGEAHLANLPKRSWPRCYLHLVTITMQKI